MRGITRSMMWSPAALICFASRPVSSEPQGAAGITVDKSSIGGVVLNSNGAKQEAGVWVIAKTNMPKFTESRLGSVNHIRVRPNPLAN
jgi:hypothetical protein